MEKSQKLRTKLLKKTIIHKKLIKKSIKRVLKSFYLKRKVIFKTNCLLRRTLLNGPCVL